MVFYPNQIFRFFEMYVLIFSFFDVDVVHGSVTFVLDHSVAGGDSEEGLILRSLEWLDVFGLKRKLGKGVLFVLFVLEVVESFFLINFSVVEEEIECRLADWDDLLENVPEDAFGERSSCERARVTPSSIVVQKLNKLGQVQLLVLIGILLLSLKHLFQEYIMVIRKTIHSKFEIIRNSTENETQDTISELRFVFLILRIHVFWFKCMNDMHFKVKKLTIDRVLRWSMEMVLQTVESGRVDVLIEEADGLSLHEVVLRFLVVHDKLKLLTLLIVLQLLLSIDILVIELKFLVLEVFLDGDICFQVDWSLCAAIAYNTSTFVGEPVIIGGHPVVFGEFTWSLIQGITVVFGVVIVKFMYVIMGTARHATDLGKVTFFLRRWGQHLYATFKHGNI